MQSALKKTIILTHSILVCRRTDQDKTDIAITGFDHWNNPFLVRRFRKNDYIIRLRFYRSICQASQISK